LFQNFYEFFWNTYCDTRYLPLSYDHKTSLFSICSPRPKRLREAWILSELNPSSELLEFYVSLMSVSCWKCRQTGLPILQKQARDAINVIFPAFHSFKQTQQGISDVDGGLSYNYNQYLCHARFAK